MTWWRAFQSHFTGELTNEFPLFSCPTSYKRLHVGLEPPLAQLYLSVCPQWRVCSSGAPCDTGALSVPVADGDGVWTAPLGHRPVRPPEGAAGPRTSTECSRTGRRQHGGDGGGRDGSRCGVKGRGSDGAAVLGGDPRQWQKIYLQIYKCP